MTSPLDVAGVEAVQADAGRLGLQWQMRTATILEMVDSAAVLATYDGDSQPTPMQLIGPRVLPGDRVQVVFVPPEGNYVLGQGLYVPGMKLLTMGRGGGTQVSTTSSAAEIAFTDYVIDVPQIAGHMIYIIATFQIFITPLAIDQLLNCRIREDSIAGTQISVEGLIARGNVFADVTAKAWVVAASTETQRYVVTAARNTGTANWGVNAAAHNIFAAFDLGRPTPGTVFSYA